MRVLKEWESKQYQWLLTSRKERQPNEAKEKRKKRTTTRHLVPPMEVHATTCEVFLQREEENKLTCNLCLW